jgi:addiction module RelE/StbE family toxin
MNIKYTAQYRKHYKKRILPNQKLHKRFILRLNIFLQNSKTSLLRDHPLKGDKKGLRAFSITDDIRVVYRKQGKTVYFLDIGTHNQVY